MTTEEEEEEEEIMQLTKFSFIMYFLSFLFSTPRHTALTVILNDTELPQDYFTFGTERPKCTLRVASVRLSACLMK
jgi:hypothetical protein